MTKPLLWLLLICATLSTSAQTPYTTLDSLASLARQLQSAAESKTYNSNGTSYKVSFSTDNFGVLVHNRLAYASVYKAFEGKERQEISENLDLSKASSLEVIPVDGGGVIKMNFPAGVLQTLVLENGVMQGNSDADYLEFFTAADPMKLYNILSELTGYLKQELSGGKDPKTIAVQWANLQKATYPAALNLSAQFLKDNPNSAYALEAKKLFDSYTARKAKEDKRAREASAALENVYSLVRSGDQTYRNYEQYQKAETAASALLSDYTETEIGSGYGRLVSFKSELQERYKWNKEYYLKKDKIDQYEASVAEAELLSSEFMRKNNATVNGSVYLKASMLALGGIAALVGAYGTIAKDDAFSPELRKGLLTYGGGAFGIGMLWTIIQGSGVKKAGRRSEAANKKVAGLKASIGEVLAKRGQTIGGKPLININ